MIGRFFGWALLCISGVLALADMTLALGPDSFDGLDTGELWTLLSGHPATFESISDTWGPWLLHLQSLPAWATLAALGLAAVLAFRKRNRSRRKAMFGTVRSSALH